MVSFLVYQFQCHCCSMIQLCGINVFSFCTLIFYHIRRFNDSQKKYIECESHVLENFLELHNWFYRSIHFFFSKNWIFGKCKMVKKEANVSYISIIGGLRLWILFLTSQTNKQFHQVIWVKFWNHFVGEVWNY